MSPSDPTAEQIRLVFVVYLSALGPLLLVPWLHARGRIPGSDQDFMATFEDTGHASPRGIRVTGGP